MGKETINNGTVAGDGSGEILFDAFEKVNSNFDELYDAGNVDTRQYTTGIANPAYQEGLTFYDNDKNALSYYNDESDTTINIGQELIIKIYNNNGAVITNGTVVRLDGGAVSGIPTVIRSIADTTVNARALGVATHDIAVDETGYITVWGTVGGVDTSTYSPGDTLFVSASVAGEVTNVEQQILKPIALVLTSAVDGDILVAQKNIVNITAIGQVGILPSATQAISTTPEVLEVYANTSLLEQNVTITQTGASPYTAEMAPASIGASGFYRVAFNITIESATNAIFFFEVYLSDVASGVLGAIDLSNANTDAGSCSFNAITSEVIDNTEDIKIYVYCDSGTPTLSAAAGIFNVERIGNV